MEENNISKRIESTLTALSKSVDDKHTVVMGEIGRLNVTVAEIKVHQKTCAKDVETCQDYRFENETEKKKTQGKLTVVAEKQKGTHKILGGIGLVLAGVAGRVIYKLFDKH